MCRYDSLININPSGEKAAATKKNSWQEAAEVTAAAAPTKVTAAKR